VTNVSVKEHFVNSDYNSASFWVLIDKEKIDFLVKVLNLWKAWYNRLRQESEIVNWEKLFEGKSRSNMWMSFKDQLNRMHKKSVLSLTSNHCIHIFKFFAFVLNLSPFSFLSSEHSHSFILFLFFLEFERFLAVVLHHMLSTFS